MHGVVAVSAIPIAVAFVVGVGGFVALLPLLIADESRSRAAELPQVFTADVHAADPAPAPVDRPVVVSSRSFQPFEPPSQPAPDRPAPSRLRLAVTIGALVVWSVWSVRRPIVRGRHD